LKTCDAKKINLGLEYYRPEIIDKRQCRNESAHSTDNKSSFTPINALQAGVNRMPTLAVTAEVDETHEENQSNRGIKGRFKIFTED
jgi:hypothetical protein